MSESPEESAAEELVVGLTGAKRAWWCVGLGVLGLLAVVTWMAAVLDRTFSLAFQGLFLSYYCLLLWIHWRPVRIDQQGIRRRGAFRAKPWNEVETLLETGRWDSTVRLRTTAGKNLPTGVSAEHLDRLAELSHKPIERRPSSSKAPTKEQRDLSERAARVKARNAELLGEPRPRDATSDHDAH